MKLIIRENGTAHLQSAQTSPALLRVIRSLEGRRKNLKAGGFSIEPTPSNIARLADAFPLEVLVEGEVEKRPPPPAPKGSYQIKTEPMPHQREAMKLVRSVTHSALFMEQGTGKSKVAIDRAGDLYHDGRISGVLTFAPKGVHRQWIVEQLEIHLGCPFRGAWWPLKKGDAASILPGEGLAWFSINVDAMKTEKGFQACVDFITAHEGRVMMIGDETHTIMNVTSARAKAAAKLGKMCAFRMALTGTPLAKDLINVWGQLRWLDENILGFRYMSAFRNEFCIMGGFQGRKIIGNRNMARYREQVDPYTFRVTKEDIGIVPAWRSRWEFDLTREQRQVIRDLKKDLISKIDSGEIVSAANAAVAMMRMQQVSNGFFVDEDKNVIRLMEPEKNPRVIALKELLASRGGKGIVWARFIPDIEIIREALQADGHSVAAYNGATSDKDRVKAVDAFLAPEGEGVNYFLSNPAAGGTGLNLQGACDYDVFYSNSDNAIQRWQAESRGHRIGMKGTFTHFDLVAPFSQDKMILGRHAAKEAISEMAIGDIRKMLEEM